MTVPDEYLYSSGHKEKMASMLAEEIGVMRAERRPVTGL